LSSETKKGHPRLERTAYELTENIPVGTYTMVQPADGGMASFSFMSKRFLDLLGLDRATVERDPVRGFDCVHPDDYDNWLALNLESFQHKKPFYGETRVVVNGQIRWVLAESIPRPLSNGSTVWEGALSDITARKVAEQSLKDKEHALLKAKQNAEEQERRKSNLLAHISHEIRTPLTSMLGIAELLGHENLNDKQRQLLKLLQQSGDSLLDILNAVLDYSRIEASRLELNEQPFNVGLLLQKVQALHQWSAESKNLRLEIGTENLADNLVVGDSVRLEQVLSNLLSNAIKFTGSGTIKLRAISEQLSDSQVRLRFEVADTGIGIDPRDITTLFIPFSQASSRRRVQTGTGLGLSISKALVELMGGNIGVESAVNQGSLFWVELTLSSTAATSGTKKTSSSTESSLLKLAHKTVMLVDDSPTVLLVVGNLLMSSGAHVIQKNSAKSALIYLKEHAFDIDAMVIDLQMPEISGLDAIRAIRKEVSLHKLPIIVLTAGLLNDERSSAFEAGANDVLFKPVTASELTRCLLRVMGAETDSEPEVVSVHDPAPYNESNLHQGFPSIEGIHLQTVIQTTAGNPNLFLKLLRIFCTENQGLSAMLIDEIQRRDYSSVMRRLHNLKGAARYIGAVDIERGTEELETFIEPCVVSRIPLPSSSQAYPIIADIQQAVSSLAKQLESP
jgi:PAS domain S-box-containing protein